MVISRDVIFDEDGTWDWKEKSPIMEKFLPLGSNVMQPDPQLSSEPSTFDILSTSTP